MVLSPSKLVTGWHQVGIKGDRASTLPFSYVDRFLQANPKKMREPTSGLEPLSCSLRVIHQPLQGVAGACKSRIFRGLLCSGLLSVAPYCAPGGVRVVSKDKGLRIAVPLVHLSTAYLDQKHSI
jgi:hypothetical protein